MNRFEQQPTPGLYVAIAVTMVGTFVADYYTPLGIAVWVVYILPIALTLFVWRPAVPIGTAALSTVLMILTYLTDRPGVDPTIARVNRIFGVLTIWLVGTVAYLFIRNRLAVRRQEWLQEGQTGLSARMGGDPTLDVLGERVLGFLCERLEAHAGAFYVAGAGALRRAAAYAAPAEGLPAVVVMGEGLVGQAARDGRALVVHDLPEAYLRVTSTLGGAAPRHLVVTPVAVDGSVAAVVELAFVHPVYAADVDLLERVAESVAVAVRSAQYRTRLVELLEETQRQAEELQSQSEELRVTNEELEEQGRVLRDSQTRLEQQQAELEQTNARLEEQAELLESRHDELARARDLLEAQAHDLEQTSRYKSEFLANMSHELRTPLNSSLILAKLLADNRTGNLTDEQVTYAQTIQSANQDLLALITDILDLSKIEAGRVEIRPQAVRIERVAEHLHRIVEPMTAEKGIAYRVTVAPGVPDAFETDPQRLEQVLKNLLSNAVKFTEKGEVSLDVRLAVDGRLAFAVRDTGIGIPAHQHDVIFEAFRQADGTTNRKYGGTGLGLSISRELVRLLGGELHLDSEVGRGSVFTVLLPTQYRPELVRAGAPGAMRPLVAPPRPAEQRPETPRPEPTPAAPPQAAPVDDDRARLEGGRRVILIVEDDPAFARILCDLAHELGFQCLIATGSGEGFALAAQFIPSAIVLDVGLPDYSGLSVLDRVKTDARTRHIPVHIVSASDYAETAYAMGAVGYMLKPVKREELVQAFRQIEDRLAQRLRRVLVVEDDPAQMESLKALLASADVETVGADSAAACLDHLRQGTFDCMVLDLSLPDASGFSLLETLSTEDRYSFPPVIVYTGRDLSADEEQALRRYSKSIIIKGAKSPERLLDEVTLFLHQVVADLPPEQQRMLERARSRDAALEGRRILVVEDDVRNVFALTSTLEPRGAAVRIARNGREALDALERADAEGQPVDLVLMDIMMPEMDGLTAMREIRRRPAWKRLPIIALTAKAMRNDQEECLAAGASDYIAKPLDVEKLLSLVRVWMPRS